ncbi:MAG: hypothetical protein KGN78_13805 [Actinomycetales bacterium]|nr:hypothetical protein [Actinomycetales bacterium]
MSVLVTALAALCLTGFAAQAADSLSSGQVFCWTRAGFVRVPTSGECRRSEQVLDLFGNVQSQFDELVARLDDTWSAMEAKADAVELADVSGRVDNLSYDIDTLRSWFEDVAPRAQVEYLAEVVDTKADNVAVESLSDTVWSLAEVVGTKADQAAVDALQGQVQDLVATLLGGDLSGVTDAITQMQAQLDDINARLDGGDFGSLSDQIAALQGQLASMNPEQLPSLVDYVDAAVSEERDRAVEVETALQADIQEALLAGLDEVNGQMASLGDAFASRDDLSGVAEDVGNLWSVVDATQAQVDAIDISLDQFALKSDLDAAISDLVDLVDSSARQEVTAEDLAVLQQTVDDQASDLQQLNDAVDQIATVDESLATLTDVQQSVADAVDEWNEQAQHWATIDDLQQALPDTAPIWESMDGIIADVSAIELQLPGFALTADFDLFSADLRDEFDAFLQGLPSAADVDALTAQVSQLEVHVDGLSASEANTALELADKPSAAEVSSLISDAIADIEDSLQSKADREDLETTQDQVADLGRALDDLEASVQSQLGQQAATLDEKASHEDLNSLAARVSALEQRPSAALQRRVATSVTVPLSDWTGLTQEVADLKATVCALVAGRRDVAQPAYCATVK